jgi:hypothetical protein
MDTNPQQYHIRRFNSANLADVEQLHTVVYGKKPHLNYFRNKYNTAHTAVGYVGFIAYADGNIPIAYYGVIPCFIRHADQVVLSAQSADTMTDPNYRFKGLFVELSNLTFQLCRDLGIRLIWGFPNQNSVHGAINKLNWQLTETLQCFIIPVKTLPLEKLSTKYPLLNVAYRAYQHMVLAKHQLPVKGIPNSVLTDGFGGVNRDDDYLNYKTYSLTRVVHIGKAIFWIKINNGLMIGDMELNDADFNTTLKRLKRIAATLGIQQIVFQTSPYSGLFKLFKQRYEPLPTFPVLFQDFESGVPIQQIKFTFADIDIF